MKRLAAALSYAWDALNGLLWAAVIMGLVGCAAPGPYWVLVYEPVAHTKTRFVDKPCGRADLDGCAHRGSGLIELRRGMTEAETWCTLNHEKKHLAGYNHPGSTRGEFSNDCGNGEIL